jgi:hypothetical protein
VTRLRDVRFGSRWGKRLSLRHSIQTGPGSRRRIANGYFREIQRPGKEADRSSRSSAGDTNTWS